MKKDYPTIVLTKSNKGIKSDQLILEIKKANDLSSVTKKKNYTILSKVVTNFYEYVYSSSDSLVFSLASQNTKCDKDKFLKKFADWLEKGYPEEAANIGLVRKYISQTDDSHNIIRKAMYEKNSLHTTSGKNYYKLSNVSYVAFLSDKVLKNDLCLEI